MYCKRRGGSCRSLIKSTTRYLFVRMVWGKSWRISGRIAGLRAEIWTRNLPNTRQGPWRLVLDVGQEQTSSSRRTKGLHALTFISRLEERGCCCRRNSCEHRVPVTAAVAPTTTAPLGFGASTSDAAASCSLTTTSLGFRSTMTGKSASRWESYANEVLS
jgi:hypothetical protein